MKIILQNPLSCQRILLHLFVSFFLVAGPAEMHVRISIQDFFLFLSESKPSVDFGSTPNLVADSAHLLLSNTTIRRCFGISIHLANGSLGGPSAYSAKNVPAKPTATAVGPPRGPGRATGRGGAVWERWV